MADAPEHYMTRLDLEALNHFPTPPQTSYTNHRDSEGLQHNPYPQFYTKPDGTLASHDYNPQNSGTHGYHEKDGYLAISQVPRADDGADGTKPNQKMRKVCGIPMLWLIAAIVLLVVIVGGVVGGVVGTKANTKPTSGDSPAESDFSASIDTSILLDTASPTATQAGSASFAGTSTAASIEPTNTVESVQE